MSRAAMVPARALAPSAALTKAGGVMHERPASRPVGHRYPGPLDAGLSGTGLVADDLYLIAHDDRTGRPHLQPRALGIGLAGALLAELMLAGWIGLRRDGTVVFAAGVAQGMVMRHALLKQIADEPGPQPLQAWLRFLAHGAARDVALRLERAGYLEHARSWIPGRQDRWVPVDPDWAFAPMLRVRSALDPARPVTAHAAALTGLAVAAGLRFRVDHYQAQAGRTIQDAVAALGPGLQELIAQTQTAVDSAVLSHRM
jgi:Golgi phosphoprotein 3 (GPP34)